MPRMSVNASSSSSIEAAESEDELDRLNRGDAERAERLLSGLLRIPKRVSLADDAFNNLKSKGTYDIATRAKGPSKIRFEKDHHHPRDYFAKPALLMAKTCLIFEVGTERTRKDGAFGDALL
ncbi:hypothetical protein NM208_g6041 [Fusarium decemcellulare]|uniref:Uncharacterized protein n=1 Tax=Fusarium decemcellulare TaxID=57161 RepID=A0ACC1SEN4_9HYPO|nr:hypothetical protein NM208_g6041 [Fusarium decemcellulare]